MDPATIGAAGAVASTALGSLFGMGKSSKEYEYARRLQKHDQAFQERMSNTAIQRQMADAEAAGLNANLLYSNGGGSGASTPSGGHSGVSGPDTPQIDPMTAFQISMQKERQNAEIDALKKQTGADVELKNAQAVLALKQAGLTDQEIQFFITHGVPAGTTISTNVAGLLSGTAPVGYNNPHGKKPKNIAQTAYNDAKDFIKKFQERRRKK